MTRDRFPSFAGLKAFYSVALEGSAVKAAVRLGISASSISHQMKSFEKELGVRLFENRKGKLHLTVDGEQYFHAIEQPMTRLLEATQDVRSAPGRRRVSLTLSPSFAAHWLLPRMRTLTEQHPDIELNLITTTRVVDLTRENVDLAVRRGAGRWDGCLAEPLLNETVLPVLSPELWNTIGKPDLAAVFEVTRALVNTTLIDEWDLWSAEVEISPPPHKKRFNLETYELTIQAARDGLGIALGRRPLIDDAIASGELVAPFETPDDSETAYYLVRHTAPLASGAKRLFDWLISQKS